MIELQKYTKVDEEQLLKSSSLSRTKADSRFKVVGYVSLAVVASLFIIIYQLSNTVVSYSLESNLRIYEEDKNSEIMKAYVNFISQMGRTYSDKAETARRYRIFKDNYKALDKHRAHEDHLSFQVNLINQFSDLTEEEFLELAANSANVPEHVMSPADSQFSARAEKVPIFDYEFQWKAPESKNWQEEGIMGDIENQFANSKCGSSWAFSTVAAMEGLHAIGGQNKTSFSAQQLIDCDVTNNGCQGGWASKGYAYSSKYGMMPKGDYPYTGSKGAACLYDETKAVFKNTGFVQARYVSNWQLKDMVSKQPVTVGIVVTNAFRNYKSGILLEENLGCSSDQKHINHQVTLVGYGKSPKNTIQSSWCKEFWVARNSWGPSWGEQGTFKICMDDAGKSKTPYGTCHINRFPSYPVSQ